MTRSELILQLLWKHVFSIRWKLDHKKERLVKKYHIPDSTVRIPCLCPTYYIKFVLCFITYKGLFLYWCIWSYIHTSEENKPLHFKFIKSAVWQVTWELVLIIIICPLSLQYVFISRRKVIIVFSYLHLQLCWFYRMRLFFNQKALWTI